MVSKVSKIYDGLNCLFCCPWCSIYVIGMERKVINKKGKENKWILDNPAQVQREVLAPL